MLQPDQKDDAQKIVAATSTESNAVEPIDEAAVPVGDGRYSKTASSAAAAVASGVVDFALFSPSHQAVSSDELGGRVRYPTTGKTEPEDSLVPQKPPPPQEPSKKEVDEAVLTRRRAMNTIHSRRKRERQRIEIEVLKEQCTEFSNKNMAIRQENLQLEALLLSLQSRGTQQEATTNHQALSSYHQPQQTQLQQQQQQLQIQQQPQPQIFAPMLLQQQPFQSTTGSYPSMQSLPGNDASGNHMMPQNEQQFTEHLHESIRQQMAMLQQLQPVAQQQQQPNNNNSIYNTNTNNAGNNIVYTNSNNSAQSNPTTADAANAVAIAILQQYAMTAAVAAAANSQQQQFQQMQQQQQQQQSSMTPQLQQQFLLAQQLYLQQQIQQQQQQQQNSLPSQPPQSATAYNQLSFGENNNNVNNHNNPPQPPSRTE